MRKSRSVGVWLIFKGREVSPQMITKCLGFEPTRQYVCGKPKADFPKAVAKTGVWSFEVKCDSTNVSHQIDKLIERLNDVHLNLDEIEGVEEALLDIFVAENDENGERVVSTSIISNSQLRKISSLGLNLSYTA